MASRVLRVQSVKGMVPRYETHTRNTHRQFIGWHFDPTIGPINPETNMPTGAYVKNSDVVELKEDNYKDQSDAFYEYITAVRQGHLKAMDKSTADICQVPFEEYKKQKSLQ